jgi:hypothetical protein
MDQYFIDCIHDYKSARETTNIIKPDKRKEGDENDLVSADELLIESIQNLYQACDIAGFIDPKYEPQFNKKVQEILQKSKA